MGATVRAVAALVAPSIAVILGVVALTGYADATSRRLAAESSFENSVHGATEARSDAMRSRLLLLRAVDEATAFATEASSLATSAGGLLDAAALEALTGALSQLNTDMPVPPPIPGLPSLAPPAEMVELAEGALGLDAWSATARGVADQLDSELTALDALVQAVRTAVARLASSAAPAGATLLGETAMASAETRAELEASLEAVATRLGAGATPTMELSRYLKAAEAARASHATAVAAAAAAAAASSSGSGGGSGTQPWPLFGDICSVLRCIDRNNPPVVTFYGNYVGAFCPYDYLYIDEYWLNDGEWIEVLPDYPDQPYGGRVIPLVHNWGLLLEYCV